MLWLFVRSIFMLLEGGKTAAMKKGLNSFSVAFRVCKSNHTHVKMSKTATNFAVFSIYAREKINSRMTFHTLFILHAVIDSKWLSCAWNKSGESAFESATFRTSTSPQSLVTVSLVLKKPNRRTKGGKHPDPLHLDERCEHEKSSSKAIFIPSDFFFVPKLNLHMDAAETPD